LVWPSPAASASLFSRQTTGEPAAAKSCAKSGEPQARSLAGPPQAANQRAHNPSYMHIS